MNLLLRELLRALLMFGASAVLYSISYPLLGDDYLVPHSSPGMWGTLWLGVTRYIICTVAWKLGLDRKLPTVLVMAH
jgi:hypothetical protein